jgi:hypothetical protein
VTAAAKVERSRQIETDVKRRAFTVHVNQQIRADEDKRAAVTRDAAAFDVVCKNGKRLKPPPLPEHMPEVSRPGARGLPKQRLSAPAMRWTGEGWKGL